MRCIRCRWSIEAMDPDGNWAVTLFDRTLFSPAGVDLYFRSPNPTDADRKAALHAASQSPLTAPYVASLRPTLRE